MHTHPTWASKNQKWPCLLYKRSAQLLLSYFPKKGKPAMASKDRPGSPLLQDERSRKGPRFDSQLEECAYESSEKVVVELDEDGEGTQDGSYTPPFSWRKMWLFMGPGFLASIAYLDPGNLEGSLQAGAVAGYSLLWLLMWATLVGLFIQFLAARVGVATGRHLAELCREEYPMWARLALWLMAELALIGADIQEVIGSAIALQTLSNGHIPLWAGVLITALDSTIFLLLENYGVRKLEALFGVLISTMGLSFAWMFIEARPSGTQLLTGLIIPRIHSNAVKQAVSIVGCSIMPHNIYLHSALVQSRAIDTTKRGRVREALNYYFIESSIALFVSFIINIFVTTVFAKGFYGTEASQHIGLANAGSYLQKRYGGGLLPILYIWGIGLLAAGQSSTITGTYAGQFIMSGFLNLRIKKWLRAIITRSFAIVPTVTVALIFDTSEGKLDALNEWLNVLQSMQIPFVLIPLLCLASKENVMGVFQIGRTLKVVYWIIAALVIIINGYLLVDFLSKELVSMWMAILLIAVPVAYISFVIYLVVQAISSDRPRSTFSKLLN